MIIPTQIFSLTAFFCWIEHGNHIRKFERRVTFCAAENRETAKSKLISEAEAYATEGIKMLDQFIFEELPNGLDLSKPSEVASDLMAGYDTSRLQWITPEEYLKSQLGSQKLDSCDNYGLNHAWHDKGNGLSGCANCEIVKEGKLWGC